MKNQKKATLFALTAILFWSTMGSAFKLTLRYMEPQLLLLYASATAVIFLGLLLLFTGKLSLLQNLRTVDILRSSLMGLCNPFLYYVVLFRAYSMIPAQEAVALNYIWPVMLVIFSIIFLRQRTSFLSILAILLSFSGTLWIATQGHLDNLHFSNPLGSLLAVGSSVFWASFFVLNMSDNREAYSKMFLNFAFGFLYILILNLTTGSFRLPALQGLAGTIYIGIFEMGLTFVLWLTALKLSATTANVSNLVYISPFLSLILISFLVGEEIKLATVVGLIIIVGGIFLQQWSYLRNPGKKHTSIDP